MLKKILEDMYIPQEILNAISEDDKQLIFLEIRKEQIRLYSKWESANKSAEEFHHKPNIKGLNIKFAADSDLVSFLGERSFDRPIEEILREEKLRKAHEEAEKAVLQSSCIDAVKSDSKTDPEHLQNVDDHRPVVATNPVAELSEEQDKPTAEIHPTDDTIGLTKTVDQKRQELVRRMSTEIFNDLLTQQNVLKERALKEHEKLQPIWQKAAKQAKLDDELRRKKASEARKFYATIKEKSRDATESFQTCDIIQSPITIEKSSQLQYVLNAINKFENLNSLDRNKNDIKEWFLKNEWKKISVDDTETNHVPEWFHGMISRQQCEQLLSKKEIGSFMIRVSEKSLCYVLSHKTTTKIKHILIQSKTDCDQYEFVGPPNVNVFKSLKDLINHFQNHFVNETTRDILTTACGQEVNGTVDYMDLIPVKNANSG